MKALIDKVYSDYRSTGFPYYDLSPEQKRCLYRKLLNHDHRSGISGDVVRQLMHGQALAWAYFPHAWNMRCNNMRSPLELFNDDLLFTQVIDKSLLYGNKTPTHSSIRKMLRVFTGTQAVSNFRPTAAAAIYHLLLPEQGGTVYDPSGGFGGRFLGTFVCQRVKRYVACEPSTDTFLGLKRMARELRELIDPHRQIRIDLHQTGSEDFQPAPHSIDCCLWSPPYFSTERYSDEPTQSWVKFPTPRKWMEGFIAKTLHHCAIGLKPTGYLAINIASTREYPNLERDFLALAEKEGWRLVRTLRLALSKMIGLKRNSNQKFKFEPIFVFQRSF